VATSTRRGRGTPRITVRRERNEKLNTERLAGAGSYPQLFSAVGCVADLG
jgi:hypothetical protein